MISSETTINSNNYRLRIPNTSDIDFVFSASRYPGFNDGMQWDPPAHKEELIVPHNNTINSWKNGSGYSFTIESKKNNTQRLGRVSIRITKEKGVWDIGYWIHPEHQGKGIMTEVVKSIAGFGFNTLKATKIRSRYAIWNKASEKVLINNRFIFVRHIENGFIKNNNWVPENEMCLTKERWTNTENKNISCNFCAEIENNKNTVFEDEHLVLLFDLDPISLGHIIICPKEHYTDFHNLPDELIHKMMSLAKRYMIMIENIFEPKGYSMMLNAGEFNDLKHCHLHIFPRNSKAEFEWTNNKDNISNDTTRFDMLKKLMEGNI